MVDITYNIDMNFKKELKNKQSWCWFLTQTHTGPGTLKFTLLKSFALHELTWI